MDILHHLRSILNKTELEETIKWNMPTYTINNKNVIGLGTFLNHAGLWFHQGALLSDSLQVLSNAQEGKTKAMRHWKFTDIATIQDDQILSYVNEAIQNEKNGRRVNVSKKPPLDIPESLAEVFDNHPETHQSFQQLTPGRQRDYAAYISSAQRMTTIEKRINTIIPLIKAGKGLESLYQKKK